MSEGTPAMWMRGGTSKGLYFLKEDIPNDITKREDFLLSVFGSPDNLQINGVGGGNPLTSKVAIVSKSKRSDVDVDYLFLQVAVDDYVVSSTQNCGNILAGIAPFAIERGLIKPEKDKTSVRIFMENSKQNCYCHCSHPRWYVNLQWKYPHRWCYFAKFSHFIRVSGY